MQKVLGELNGVDATQRHAHFRSVIAITFPDDSAWWVDGVLDGRILFSPIGEGGFGYDAIFAPRNSDLSLAQLEADEKNAFSHRGRALRAFAAKIAR